MLSAQQVVNDAALAGAPGPKEKRHRLVEYLSI